MPYKYNPFSGEFDRTDNTGSSTSSNQFDTDSGTAIPAANVITIAGGNNINTSGAGSTVTIDITAPVTVANGGTGATSLTDGGILLGSGTGAVTVTSQPTNGQLLIGSTGVDPVLATLTGGTGITITGGAGSITIDADNNGDVVGPGSAVDSNVVSFDGTSGKLIKDSGIAQGDVVQASAALTQYRVIVGDVGSKDVVALSSVGTSGQVLTSNGAGANPTWQDNPQGTVTSVSGTLNRISIGGTAADPVVDIDAAYVGQSSITTLGTIGTGTWEATDVGVAHGGTGRSTATAYAVLCGGTTATGAHQSIASVGTSGQVLTSNGAAALPTFQTLSAGDVSGPGSSTDNALARWNGTGGDTLQDSTVIVSDNGEMTNASQPGFFAYNSATDSNVTGDGTVYTVICDTEEVDKNSDYNNTTGVFTAPLTGLYVFSGTVTLTGVGASHTTAIFQFVGPKTYRLDSTSPAAIRTSGNVVSYTASVVMYLTASDTVSMRIQVSGSTKTISVNGSGTNNNTFFSGQLLS